MSRWTEDESNEFDTLVCAGVGIGTIAKNLNRSQYSVVCRLLKATGEEYTEESMEEIYGITPEIVALFNSYENKTACKKEIGRVLKINFENDIQGTKSQMKIWSSEEEVKLTEEIKEGKTVKEIAENHNRTEGGIRSRIKKLQESHLDDVFPVKRGKRDGKHEELVVILNDIRNLLIKILASK